MNARKAVVCALCLAQLAGCALTPDQFRASRTTIPDEGLCRTWRAASKSGATGFEAEVGEEARRRGLSVSQCVEIIKQSEAAAAVALGALLVIGAVAAAKRGGGGGSSSRSALSSLDETEDTDWHWDQFYNEQRVLVWACRGEQTGQFAPESKCALKIKSDFKWPGTRFY